MPEIQPELAEFASAELRRRGIEISPRRRSSGSRRQRSTLSTARSSRPAPSSGRRASSRTRWSRSSGCRSTRRPHRRRPVLRGAGRPGRVGDRRRRGVPDPASKGNPSPPTAQHVFRQAKVAGDNVAHALAGEPEGAARSAIGRSACSWTWAAPGGRQHARHQLARLPGLVPRPHLPPRTDAGWGRRARLVTDWTTGSCSGATRPSSASSATRRSLEATSAGGTVASEARRRRSRQRRRRSPRRRARAEAGASSGSAGPRGRSGPGGRRRRARSGRAGSAS